LATVSATYNIALTSLDQLEPEDREFVLTYGALKDVAEAYGLRYPTLGARLDRLIERLRQAIDRRQPDPMADRGKLIYYREGGSERHLRDIAGILKLSSAMIDCNYLA
jgi:hypothetical protein